MTPYIKDDKTAGATYTLPCGKCPHCLQRRISGWSFRLMQEERYSTSAMFLTLTYDTEHVPISKKGYMTLDSSDDDHPDQKKRHLQLFIKKLRKAQTKKYGKDYPKIKYYAVGEYGTHGHRPHYHLIIFNARLELIQPAWNLGQIHYGHVSHASVGYCLKYISKSGVIPMHANDDRLPEFSLFSKGLGSQYLTKSSVKYHKADPAGRNFLTIEDGKKIAIPRYYKERLYDEDEKSQIQKAALERHAEALEKALNDPDYNQNRYDAQQSQIAAFKQLKKNLKKGHL